MSCLEDFPQLDDGAFTILRQFYEYDRDVSLEARVLSRDEKNDYAHEKFTFRSVNHSLVPGYLTIPTSGTLPYPCVLLVHGMGGSKEDDLELESEQPSVTKELVSAGFAVLALDGPIQGERAAENDYESIYSYIRPNRYRELVIQWAIEHRMAMDYLSNRSEFDPARIGALGYSLGGVVVFNLVGVDPRIKAAATVVTLPLSLYYINRIGWDQNALLRMAPIAPQTFAPRINNPPFLMLNGLQDPWAETEDVQELFALIGSPIKERVLLDCGHHIPFDHVSWVVDWFTKHLK